MIDEVPAVAGSKTFKALVYIHSDLWVVSPLIVEVRLMYNETPIQMDGGPNNWFTLWVSPGWHMSYEPPRRLLNEYDIKVINRQH